MFAIPEPRDTDSAQDRVTGASFYSTALHNPHNAYVVASYVELRRIILSQYRELVAGGFRFDFRETDPYRDSAEMLEDARNSWLLVFADEGETLPHNHPMRERVWTGSEHRALNDIFRGVHDVMGHLVAGSGFGPVGEYNAWLAHRRTMTPLALSALWCETRGQNLWTNFYGDHADRPAPERPFAAQKSFVVPETLR